MNTHKHQNTAFVIAALLAALPACLPQSARAQQQPGLAPTPPSPGKDNGGGERKEIKTPPPPVDPLSGPNLPLTAKERQGVAYGKQWAGNKDKPARGEDGGAVFVFGATLPTVVCAPFFVCDLVLQPGETVNDLNAGDSVRWKITPAAQGAGTDAVTHVMIKPSDVGLVTNLVITTSRRAYVIKLVSQREEWMPKVSFEYPDEAMARWSGHRAEAARLREAAEASTGESSARLDFGYRLSGDSPSWRPIRVYTDGSKTYIQFPPEAAHGDLPALVALADDPSFLGLATLFSGPNQQMVNYRLAGDRFEVDKALNHAALVLGVGDAQISVEITRERRD